MARYPIKMLLDKDLGPFIPYLPSNAVVVEGSDETVADQIIDLHNEIEEKITNVYRYKGSVTFENLPTTGQVTGDVYNITNDFELDGHLYSEGTNLAWAEDHWDPLAGLTNLDNTVVELNLSVDLMPTVRSINGYAFTIEANKVQWLKMINDAIKAGKTTINFITTRDTGYFFRLYIPNTSDGVQNVSMFITTPINLLYNLQYGDTYWFMKTIKITFADNVATDITVQTGTAYSYKEWMYPQFRNTTAFTPTAATHLATKKYVDDTLNNTAPKTIPLAQNNEFSVIFENLAPGVYYRDIMGLNTFQYKLHTSDSNYTVLSEVYPEYLIMLKNIADIPTPASGQSEVFALLRTYYDGATTHPLNQGECYMHAFTIDSNNAIVDTVFNCGRYVNTRVQWFTGAKHFSDIPTTSANIALTSDAQLTYKKYVDDAIAKVTTMPTADSTLEGKVYQYIGATGGSYTKGYFYECVSDGGSPATYSWNEIQFSGGGGGATVPLKYLNNNGTDFQTNNINGNIDATDLTNLINAANEALADGYESFVLLVNDNNAWHSGSLCYLVKISSSSWNLLTFKCIGASRSIDKVDSVGSAMNTFYISGTRSGNTITALDNYVGGGGGGSFLLYTDNANAYTPTQDYHPSTKKYTDDAIKGTDLSQYVELAQSTAGVTLNHIRYANIGDSFSLTYIAHTTADTLATAFYVKLPASHYYKMLPSAYTYEPIGAVTYFEYDSQTQSADPKNAYGYLTYNPSDPDYVEIKIYPVDYSGQVGILANSYFYVNCNWIRI